MKTKESGSAMKDYREVATLVIFLGGLMFARWSNVALWNMGFLESELVENYEHRGYGFFCLSFLLVLLLGYFWDIIGRRRRHIVVIMAMAVLFFAGAMFMAVMHVLPF